jgi:hypothetical protein
VIFDLALVSLMLAFMLWIFAPLFKRRFAQAEEARRVRAKFYDAAERLLDNDGFPPALAGMVVFMARRIMSRTLLWSFTSHAVRGRWLRPSPTVMSRFKADIDKLTPEEQRRLFELVGLFLVALTFNNAVLGALWRRVLLVATPGNAPSGDIRHTEAVLADIGSRDLAAA